MAEREPERSHRAPPWGTWKGLVETLRRGQRWFRGKGKGWRSWRSLLLWGFIAGVGFALPSARSGVPSQSSLPTHALPPELLPIVSRGSLQSILQEKGVAGPSERRTSPSARTPAAKAPTAPKVHVVRQGETLWEIARAYGVAVEAIIGVNGLRGELIKPGQSLRIPRPGASALSPALSRKPAAKATTQRAVHTVRAGETLWDIAQQYGVTIDAIGQANRLPDLDRLWPGQRLVIPLDHRVDTASWNRPAPRPGASSVYVVRPGDTLSGIARRFGVSVEALAGANGLANVHSIRVGQRLVVPGTATIPRVRQVAGMAWPSRGKLTSGFGRRWRRHHTGIDLAAPIGTPIYAARDGRVIFAGWYYGYGRTVIIDHGGGVTTLYGHASKILVRTGQAVRQGQLIAQVGRTGYTTGPHLHFEVRIHGTPVDPLRYLQ